MKLLHELVSAARCMRSVGVRQTRVLVTHGVQWLPRVDEILVIVNGEVSESGSYEQLLSHDGVFAQFLKTHLTAELSDSDDDDDDESERSAPVHHLLY